MKKLTALALASLLLVSLFAGCSSSNQEAADPTPTNAPEATEAPTEAPAPVQDNLVIATTTEPDYLDSHRSVASGTEEILFNLFEGLLKPDETGALQPAVASDYTISEDGLVYTFTLRDGVKFHNGNDVTIEDVEYSYRRLAGEYTEEPLSSLLAGVAIEVLDEKTIQFTLESVNAGFLVGVTEAVMPAELTDDEYNQSPVGTGPYKFVEYTPSQSVKLTKFDDYYGEKASITDVEFRIFGDDNAAFMSLLAGEIDLFPRISSENISELPENYDYLEGMQNMVQLMPMNTKNEYLSDLKVRQAINYAVDVDMIIEGVAAGQGTKLGSNMSPVMAVYYQDGLADKYNVDVEKAKALLKEAGYDNGFDITISVPSNYDFHVKTAEMIVEQLKAVNINAEIELVEWGVWLERIYAGRDYDMTVIAFTGKIDANDVLKRYATDYSRNFTNFSSARYDEIIKEAVLTTDAAKRAELYKEAQVILADEVPAVFIMDPSFIVAKKANLKGYKLYPIYAQDLAALSFE